MIRAVQGPRLTDSKDSQTFRTDTKTIKGSNCAAVFMVIGLVPTAAGLSGRPQFNTASAPTTLPRALPPEQNCRYSGANETRAALSAANGVCTDGQAPQGRRHRRGSRVRRAHRPGPGIRDLACRAQGPQGREGSCGEGLERCPGGLQRRSRYCMVEDPVGSSGEERDRVRDKWWAGKDLNPRHHAYQACALTLSYQPVRVGTTWSPPASQYTST